MKKQKGKERFEEKEGERKDMKKQKGKEGYKEVEGERKDMKKQKEYNFTRKTEELNTISENRSVQYY